MTKKELEAELKLAIKRIDKMINLVEVLVIDLTTTEELKDCVYEACENTRQQIMKAILEETK